MGFKLFGVLIPYYGLCIVIGIIFASILASYLCKKLHYDFYDLIVVAAYAFALGFAGAKLLYVLVSIKQLDFHQIFASRKSFNEFLNGGFVLYGGLLGALLAFPLVKKLHKIDSYKYGPMMVPCFALAHGWGRVGCLLAGCCYGKVAAGSFYIQYDSSLIAPCGVHLIPVQGIEAALLFVLAAAFTVLVLKKARINLPLLYLCLYSVIRFILEFFRGDEVRGLIGALSTSQIISIVLFLVSCLFYL